MRRFNLVRNEDASGVSGIGNVAQGVEFDDGTCAMRWLTATASTALYASVDDVVAIHGHEGRTLLKYDDNDDKIKEIELVLSDQFILLDFAKSGGEHETLLHVAQTLDKVEKALKGKQYKK